MFVIPENLILIIYTQPSPHLNKKQKTNMTKKKTKTNHPKTAAWSPH